MGVVIASQNYPYKNSEPAVISIDGKELDESALKAASFNSDDAHICFAGVSMRDGKLLASGGRVLVCVGLGDSIELAKAKAYALAARVSFKGAKYRRDIAYQALR